MGRSERDMLVAEANMPIEELMAKYSAAEPPPATRLKRQAKEQHKSPMIRAKKAPQAGNLLVEALKPVVDYQLFIYMLSEGWGEHIVVCLSVTLRSSASDFLAYFIQLSFD